MRTKTEKNKKQKVFFFQIIIITVYVNEIVQNNVGVGQAKKDQEPLIYHQKISKQPSHLTNATKQPPLRFRSRPPLTLKPSLVAAITC